MRGKREFLIPAQLGDRNIPAYAGKTNRHRATLLQTPEHPRVCGENYPLVSTITLALGTSPRMRGKLGVGARDVARARNIPAYAGKTHLRHLFPSHPTEHPRVCGETCKFANRLITETGTSPCMRGKLTQGLPEGIEERNIPAYAGKTPRKKPNGSSLEEHPRVCGENSLLVTFAP